jgi:hypothetical protein
MPFSTIKSWSSETHGNGFSHVRSADSTTLYPVEVEDDGWRVGSVVSLIFETELVQSIEYRDPITSDLKEGPMTHISFCPLHRDENGKEKDMPGPRPSWSEFIVHDKIEDPELESIASRCEELYSPILSDPESSTYQYLMAQMRPTKVDFEELKSLRERYNEERMKIKESLHKYVNDQPQEAANHPAQEESENVDGFELVPKSLVLLPKRTNG